MTSRRLLKAAEAIREVVASAILTEIRDPRVKDVTVIGVEVTPDMREAVVSVSVMGDESQKQLSLRGLQNSAGFLQSKIARRIDTRYTPRLRFELNRGLENALVVGELLGKIRREKEEEQSQPQPSDLSEPDADADSAAVDSGDPGGGEPSEGDPEVMADAGQNDAGEDDSGGDSHAAQRRDPRPPETDG